MSNLKALRKKAVARPKGSKAKVLSTSEARANFADALETTQVDGAVIGFDRYGKTIAAMVPIEAIYILAGFGNLVDPVKRAQIEAEARTFAANVPYRMQGETAPAVAAAPALAKRGKTARKPPLRKRP